MARLNEKAEEILQTLKLRETDDATTLHWFVTSPIVQKVVMAWKHVEVKVSGGGKPPDDQARWWDWIWSRCSYSAEDWLLLAGVPNLPYGLRLLDRIIRLRLVYPDQTFPRWVDRYITLSAVKATTAVSPKMQQPPKPPKEEPEA